MPINDSAGVGVYLIDKSQRASVAIGFRSAGAIEADRGLCGAPTLISSEDDYVKTFGTPSLERHGSAALEAYLLAQRGVPQVLTRAKNPNMAINAKPFGMMKISASSNALTMNSGLSASSVAAPTDASTALFYFKGEGDYCKDNVVVRFSKPQTQSAYAKEGRTIRMQVFDFDGAPHIDTDVTAQYAFNPDVSSMIGSNGKFSLACATVDDAGMASGSTPITITAYLNGIPHTYTADYKDVLGHSATNYSFMYTEIANAIKAVSKDGNPIIKSTWSKPFTYSNGVYELYSGATNKPQELNGMDLSIAVTMTVTLKVSGTPTTGLYSYPCGSVEVDGTAKTAKVTFNTRLYLKNLNEYMFLGPQFTDWASRYATYCKEDYTFSLSYDDYDANYISMQADAVLAGSNYIVSKSTDTFADYTIDYGKTTDKLTTALHYFTGDIAANTIDGPSRSYAYSVALTSLLADNLTRWRCLATPNLGDVMNQSDFISAITAANESTLGLSNIGRAASVDVFHNLEGRHGNRFIADYSQYAYRTLAGKRTPVTMATLVADLLNSHYNAGIEARPPFGYTYGQISCMSLSQQFSGAERSILAREHKVNPVIEEGGYYIWDERTSQVTDTSLSDIHCIISFIWMKFAIYDAMKSFIAEYNDASTVNRGLAVLNQLNQTFISRNYIEEGKVSADKNVIGDEVLRFDYAVRFKGVARFVDVYITAYSQTQTLAVSLSQEA